MDLVKKQEMAVEIPQEVAALFDLSNNMEGAVPRLQQVKIIHAGQLFEMPDGSKPETFEGVIIDKHAARAWWEASSGEGTPASMPDCFSMDGIYPSPDSEKKQCDECKKCPMSQYGSDPKTGKGQACKDMRRVMVLTNGSLLPKRFTIGPTSLANFDDYTTALFDMGLPYAVVVTEFSLERREAGTNVWSVIKATKKQILSREEILKVAEYIKKYKDAARIQDIKADEYYTDSDENKENTDFNYGANAEPESDIPY